MSELIEAYRRTPSFFGPDHTDESIQILSNALTRGWLYPGCIRPPVEYPVNIKYSPEYIYHCRSIIYQSMVERVGVNLTTLSSDDIQFLGNKYFEIFIGDIPDNILYQIGTSKKHHVGECTTIVSPDFIRHMISISPEIIIMCFVPSDITTNNLSNNPLELNGVTVSDRIALLQVAMEHEIIHCIINDKIGLPKCGDKIYQEHGQFFRALSKAMFGHTNTKGLISINSYKNKSSYTILDLVSFQHNNKDISGTIIKSNAKTAKVIVVNDNGDEEEYRVPYDKLKSL